MYIHCGQCAEGSAQPRRQTDIMVKRVPSIVILYGRILHRAVQYLPLYENRL
jgi:hypothetical protein